MHLHYKEFLVAAAVTLQPAAASETTLHIDDIGLAEHVALAMQSRYQHSLALRSAPIPVVQARAVSRPHKVPSDFNRPSASSAAVRFLYSAFADSRAFLSYSASQRGRPAELRVVVRISL